MLDLILNALIILGVVMLVLISVGVPCLFFWLVYELYKIKEEAYKDYPELDKEGDEL